ncbi:hypothetical protein FDP41_010331 [Naegleria fowleri]|uniref:Uncharacterized protein n=1 Tax=Naegleria fowleri TaxID=5763 RepID=A0A6A5C688_NAEFO|nr:uncharacterized protein FDP41_010331 [Naegleria fowleri]KAF0983266.1 hypothetical protein FDP41_010331 [Naegleria fowleri]
MYSDIERSMKSREHTREAHLWKSGLYGDIISSDSEYFDLEKNESHRQAFLISGQRIIGTGSLEMKSPKVFFQPTRMNFELFDMIDCDSCERIKKICANHIGCVILTSNNRVFLSHKRKVNEETRKVHIDGIEYFSNFYCIDHFFTKTSEFVEDVEITLRYTYFLTNSGKLYALEIDPLTSNLELILNSIIRYIKSTKSITYAVGYRNDLYRITKEAVWEDISHLFSNNLREKEFIKSIACCASHCFFISNHNRVFGMGNNEQGQLGGGLSFSKNKALTEITLPFENSFLKQIVTGNEHTLILSTSGDVYGCGEDKMIGTKKNVTRTNQWKKVKDNISQIYADVYSSYLISKKSNLFVCGSNIMGCLGLSFEIQEVCTWKRITLGTNKIVPWMKCGFALCFLNCIILCRVAIFKY